MPQLRSFGPSVLSGLALAIGAETATAASIDLASTMQGSGRMSESFATGVYAQVGLSPNGMYDLTTNQKYGTVNLFPNGTNFGIGSVAYNEAGLTGTGTETRAISSLDTSDFWQAGSSTTDINDATGLDFWFFGTSSSIVFGGLDANDTVTFVNGQLTSIDLSTSVTVNVDLGGFGTFPFVGAFTIAGSQLDVAINSTNSGSTFISTLSGNVNAVPEPASLGLLAFAAGATLRRRRRA